MPAVCEFVAMIFCQLGQAHNLPSGQPAPFSPVATNHITEPSLSISHRALFLAAILARMVLPAQAPPIYVIRTIVGSGANPLQTAKDLDVISGSEATLVQLSGLIRDANGRLYSTERNVIRRYDPVTGPNGSRTCGIPNVQDLTGRINKDRL